MVVVVMYVDYAENARRSVSTRKSVHTPVLPGCHRLTRKYKFCTHGRRSLAEPISDQRAFVVVRIDLF